MPDKSYKIVSVFKLKEGKANAEIERCKSPYSLLNKLKKFAGFISYEVLKINETGIINFQNWKTRKHIAEAMPKAVASCSAFVLNRRYM